MQKLWGKIFLTKCEIWEKDRNSLWKKKNEKIKTDGQIEAMCWCVRLKIPRGRNIADLNFPVIITKCLLYLVQIIISRKIMNYYM